VKIVREAKILNYLSDEEIHKSSLGRKKPKPNYPHPVGAANHMSKLNPDKVRSIRTYRGKLSDRKTAKLFDVTKTTVRNIWFGITWRHVE